MLARPIAIDLGAPIAPPPVAMAPSDPADWLRLTLVREDARTRMKQRLLGLLGSPRAVFEAAPGLRDAVPEDVWRELVDPRFEREARAELARVTKIGAGLVTLDSGDYPAWLAEIDLPPLVLSVLGNLAWPGRREEIDQPGRLPAVAIVGTRRARARDALLARSIAHDLAERGVVIVSGLAYGVDRAAHEGALEARGGRTVAVLGNGLGRVYPAAHRKLASRIRERGALVSEFPVDAAPLPWRFPQRNRVLAGLCQAVIIVAGADGSGSYGTGEHANNQGRTVFAVPGPIDEPLSRTPHLFLKSGAKLFEHPDDVLVELKLKTPAKGYDRAPVYRTLAARRSRPPLLPGVPGRIEALLRRGTEPRFFDQIVREAKVDPGQAVAALGVLELKRRVVRSPEGAYVAAPP